MLLRICSRCGKRLQPGETCDCVGSKSQKKQHNQRYDRYKRNKERAEFYVSPAWQSLKRAAKARAYGLDELRLYQGRMVPGDVVHHIIPITDDPGKRLDADNLICVSNQTHRYIHAQYDRGGRAKKEMQTLLFEIRKSKKYNVKDVHSYE